LPQRSSRMDLIVEILCRSYAMRVPFLLERPHSRVRASIHLQQCTAPAGRGVADHDALAAVVLVHCPSCCLDPIVKCVSHDADGGCTNSAVNSVDFIIRKSAL